jgi:signal transduction histidine kinase
VESTLGHSLVDARACRRIADVLHLDAVGVVRPDSEERTLAWWSAPGRPALPLDVDTIVDGRADGWIVAHHGEDVVFGRLTEETPPTAASRLGAMLDGDAPDAAQSIPANGADEDDAILHERTRWAYAIHDGLTQAVTASLLDLEWLARQTDADRARMQAAVAEAADGLRRALEDVRSILAVVTPRADGEDDTRPALDRLLELVSQRWHVPASWSIDGDIERLPASLIDAATSVIREGVANAAKHSSSRRVAVHVHARPTEMEVRIEDEGQGFRPGESPAAPGHLGLEMMRRRVSEMHGTLDIESEPGRGTRVVARLPVEQGETP